jgi:hypothetical protein
MTIHRQGQNLLRLQGAYVEDAKTELIVAVKTTPGNAADGRQLPELVDGRAGEVNADQAYDREANHAPLAGLGVARASAGGWLIGDY